MKEENMADHSRKRKDRVDFHVMALKEAYIILKPGILTHKAVLENNVEKTRKSQQEFKELKASTLKDVVDFLSMIPELEEYIDQETNLEILQWAISELHRINSYLLGLFAQTQRN